MTESRIAKVVMVGCLALFALLVTFDNLTDYDTNYAFWLAHKPKPVTKKVGKKTETITPAYKPAPPTPKGCTPQGTAG